MDERILHNILLKAAKEAQYTNVEIEQINLQSESLFIKYFLEREAAKIVENTKIEEKVLEDIYAANQGIFRMGERVKIDTIFTKDESDAQKALEEVNTKNFEKIKEKYDKKAPEAIISNDDFIFVSELQGAIAEVVSKENKKGLIKKIVPVVDGFHIIYIKDREAEREATFEEAKPTILARIKDDIFAQAYNKLIQDIANSTVNLQKSEEENKEK